MTDLTIMNGHRGWLQGHFIDGPEYRHMGAHWKERHTEHERLLVRPSPKGNAICTATDPETAAWIAERLNLAAKLEAQLAANKS